jgi:hypothetical protein
VYFYSHSIAWLRSKDSAKQAANELNGKLINGCLLLVKPLAGCLSVPEQTTAAKVVREEKLPGVCHLSCHIRKMWPV